MKPPVTLNFVLTTFVKIMVYKCKFQKTEQLFSKKNVEIGYF